MTSYIPKRGATSRIQRMPGVKNAIFNEASRIAGRAGDGFEPRESRMRGKARPRAVALTITGKAINKNRKHNTLLRSMR